MKITMAHGSGGRETSRLIDEIFLNTFGRHSGNGSRDAVVLNSSEKIAFTTDSFVVKPLFFAGGDIGRLAVCGTVNDLLTSGAEPKYLSAAFILEEGVDTEELTSIAGSMARTAVEAGVNIVTGDTKVIEGNGGVYINTSGVGIMRSAEVSFSAAKVGDSIIVTGTLGDHHACILSARMRIENDIKSDAAPLTAIAGGLIEGGVAIHGMRDITRGGLATVLWELSRDYWVGFSVHESKIPVHPQVAGICGILGLDPLYMGNEGKMLIAVPEKQTAKALDIIRSLPYGAGAERIGEVCAISDGVVMITSAGGKRLLGALSGEGLPRIC